MDYYERFQFKLYKLLNEGSYGITWSKTGESILIDVIKFKKFLSSRANCLSKSKNLSSFIRKLYLYGFKTFVHLNGDPENNKNIKEYCNAYFIRGRYDLLDKVTRNSKASEVSFDLVCFLVILTFVSL